MISLLSVYFFFNLWLCFYKKTLAADGYLIFSYLFLAEKLRRGG